MQIRRRGADIMSIHNGKGRRVLSYDERALWTDVAKSIAPLRVQQQAASEDANDITVPQPAAHIPQFVKSIPQSPPSARPPLLTPLGRRMKQRVVRGKQAIDARFDLHGLTQAEAYIALLRFLRTASARGAHLVLVITGKGSKNLDRRGGEERGVLRRQVPQWLSLPEFRKFVIGFEDAHIAHGGEGALYVRVRRS
jgi:DNA-nicking Smr family endonuclease